MAQKIRFPRDGTKGDGFQFKPEKVLVASKQKTTELQILTKNTKFKVVCIERQEFVEVKYVRSKRKFSLESSLAIIGIAVTTISIVIYFLDKFFA